MRNTLVIAWRELEERRLVPVAAIAFALLPIVLAMIPGIGGKSPRDAITIGSVVLSICFTLGLAAILGVSIVGRDLSEGRMSFYFSRPVGAASIWAGKVMAAAILIALSFLLIGAPARFFGDAAWTQFWQLTQVLPSFAIGGTGGGIVLGTALVLFFVAHMLGTIVRSRSPLIVLDFVAAVMCGVAVPFLIRPLLAGWARGLAVALGTGLGCAFVIVLACAGAWQLAHGRTDRKRNHSALSQFLWSSMAIVLILGAAFVTWVVSAKPNDLNAAILGQRAPAGPWLVLMGRAANRGDYRAGFLVNSETGDFTRFDPFAIRSIHFSPDGRSVYFLKPGTRTKDRVGPTTGEADLYMLRLGDSKPSNTGIVFKHGWADFYGMAVPTARFFVSSDGSRIATVEDGLLSVHDVARKQSLASVRLGPASFVQGLFVSQDVVRLYEQQTGLDNRKLEIVEFDVRAKSLATLGGILPEKSRATTDSAIAAERQMFLAIDLDPTATRMLVGGYRHGLVTLCDARTGAAIRTLADDAQVWNVRYLRDGRVAIIRLSPTASTLMLLSSDGALQREIPLGAIKTAFVVGDDGTHAVVLTRSPTSEAFLSINLKSGIVERRLEHVGEFVLADAYSAEMRSLSPNQARVEVFYTDQEHHLMAWNPTNGATRPVFKG